MALPMGGVDAWQPVHVEDSDQLAALVGDPDIEVVDTIDQQRADLARLLPAPQSAHVSEPTRWYYYPWQRCVVHLLGPAAFRSVRADRNRDKITADEQQRLQQLRVGVVGLSSGYAISHALVLEGICQQIRLADFDDIELSNLNRVPGTVFDLGANKAVVAARRMAELDPYVDVRLWPGGLDMNSIGEFLDGLDVVIEQCDSFEIKLEARLACRRLRVPVIMATSDRGMLDVERYDLESDRPPFHGLLGDVQPNDFVGMAVQERISYFQRILSPDQLSPRMAASLGEIGATVSTWPQLASDIYLGAATAAAAVRRLGLGQPLPSGRVRIDLDEILGTSAPLP